MFKFFWGLLSENIIFEYDFLSSLFWGLFIGKIINVKNFLLKFGFWVWEMENFTKYKHTILIKRNINLYPHPYETKQLS